MQTSTDPGSVVNNPMNTVGDKESASVTFAEVEAALAEGGLTQQKAAEATRAMEALMANMVDEKVDRLKAEMGGAAFGIESTVRSIYGRLTECVRCQNGARPGFLWMPD